MSNLVKGYWDCPFCGSKGIGGDVINCPSCGRARGEVQFYMKGHAEGETREENERSDVEYLDEEQAKYVSKNPDWYCSFCNSLNSDNAQFCGNCGASREDSESNYFQMLEKKKAREAAEAAAQSQGSQAPQKQSRKPLMIILALLLVAVGLYAWMNGDKTASDLKVSALNWVRNINIEENRMYSESDWELWSITMKPTTPIPTTATAPSARFPTNVPCTVRNTIPKRSGNRSTGPSRATRPSTITISGGGRRPGMCTPPEMTITPPGRNIPWLKTSAKANEPKYTALLWSTRTGRKQLRPTGWMKATG